MKIKRMAVLLVGVALLASCDKKPQESPDPTTEPTLEQKLQSEITGKVDTVATTPEIRTALRDAVASIRQFKGGNDTILMVNASGKGFLQPGRQGNVEYPPIQKYDDMRPSTLFSWRYELYTAAPKGADDLPVVYGQYYYLESEEQRADVLRAIAAIRFAIKENGELTYGDHYEQYSTLAAIYPASYLGVSFAEEIDKIPNVGGLFGGIKSRMMVMYLGRDGNFNPTLNKNYSFYDNEDDVAMAKKELDKIEALMKCMPLGVMMLNNATEQQATRTRATGSYNSSYSNMMMEDGSANISGGRVIRHRLGIP